MGSTLINAAIPFILLPFLTKFLSKADLGIIFMFSTLTSFITPFVNVNMDGAITRVFYRDKENFYQYIGNTIIISLICTVLLVLLSFIVSPLALEYTSLTFKWVSFCVLTCFAQFLILILLTLYRIHLKPLKYGILQVSLSAANLILSLILIGLFHFKWEGRLLAQVVSTIFFASFCFFVLKFNYKISFKIEINYIKHALKFGGGLIPHTIGMSLILLTNRFFLLKMVNLDETGMFGVASMLASVISFVTFSFNNAYVPWLYEKLNLESLSEKFKLVRFTYVYFLIILAFGLIFYFFLPLVYHFFINIKFQQSLKYTPWLILGFLFQGMYLMVTNYIIYSEKTHMQAIVTIIIGILNVPITYFSISFFGSYGAAFSFSFSFFLLFIFTWILSMKVYPMPWFSAIKLTKQN